MLYTHGYTPTAGGVAALFRTNVFGCILLLLAASASDAAPITFDLTGSSNTPPGSQPVVISSGGVDLSVTGWRVDDSDATGGTPAANAPFASLSPRGLSQTANGIGVYNGPGSIDSTQTDGLGPDEVLRFQFSAPVLLGKVVFALVSSNDEFDFGVGSDLDPANVLDVRVNQTYGDDSIIALATPLGPPSPPFLDFEFMVGSSLFVGPTPTVSIAPIGQTFEFYLSDQNDDYKIVELTVETGVDPDGMVPEPNTAMLALLGMLGVATAVRRAG